MNKFKACNNQGKKYEVETLKYIDYDDYEISQGYCKAYDIKYTKNDIVNYIEVKSERNAVKYGNFAIEYSYKNYPSGINATIAEYFFLYAVYDDNKYDVYKVPTKIIKQMINNKEYVKNVEKCGDGGHSKCYIIKCTKFDEYKLNPI